MHAPQNRVAAGLHWNVRMLGDARGPRDQGNQFVAPVHRFDRTDSELFEGSVVEDGADEVNQSLDVSRWSLAKTQVRQSVLISISS